MAHTLPDLPYPHHALEPHIDALVIGEGEAVTPLLLRAYDSGDFTPLHDAAGVVYRPPAAVSTFEIPAPTSWTWKSSAPLPFPHGICWIPTSAPTFTA